MDEGLGDQRGNPKVAVIGENIGTGGCESKSAALRGVIKQGVLLPVLHLYTTSNNTPMGTQHHASGDLPHRGFATRDNLSRCGFFFSA